VIVKLLAFADVVDGCGNVGAALMLKISDELAVCVASPDEFTDMIADVVVEVIATMEELYPLGPWLAIEVWLKMGELRYLRDSAMLVKLMAPEPAT
jgi:hypothetical protein